MRQPQWIKPSVAAYTSGRPEATIRDWIRRGLLATTRCPRTHYLLVNAAAVRELAMARHAKPRKRTRPARGLHRIL